jgi:hypothetical protein
MNDLYDTNGGESNMFTLESDTEVADVYRLYVQGVRVDEQFIAELRELAVVDYTAQYRTGNSSFVDIYLMRSCRSADLAPLITPIVDRQVARKSAGTN